MDRNISTSYPQSAVDYDTGLRTFLLSVYNRLFGAIGLTGILAYAASVDPLRSMLFTGSAAKLNLTGLGLFIVFAPLLLILVLGFSRKILGSVGSTVALWGVAGLFGLSMGTVFIQYTGASIANTFFATASAFGALSIYGHTTKRDLQGLGTFLVAALFGLIAVSLISLFIQSSALQYAISAAGVVLFSIFIAYDTQKLKTTYSHGGDLNVQANLGALDLYLDFLNLFLFLLRFVGVNVSTKSD